MKHMGKNPHSSKICLNEGHPPLFLPQSWKPVESLGPNGSGPWLVFKSAILHFEGPDGGICITAKMSGKNALVFV